MMTPIEEAEVAFDFHQMYTTKNISAVRKKLYKSLDLLIFLNEILAEKGIQVRENEVLSEQLVMKFYLHGLSVCKIGESFKVSFEYFQKDIRMNLIDISSLVTVGRAQLETLLMYQHLYINSDNEEENKLRYYSWIYTALLQRSRIKSEDPFVKEQLTNDEKSMIDLRAKMKGLSAYLQLSEKQKKSLFENGSGKLFKTWDIIFKESGFEKETLFSKWYYLISTHAHSEGLSVLQMKQAKYFPSDTHNSEMIFMQTLSSLIMSSIMIQNISNNYEAVKERYNSIDEKVRYELNLYRQTAYAKLNNSK